MSALDYSKVEGLKVKLDDGSVWDAEIDSAGKIELIRQIEPPEAPSPPEPDDDPWGGAIEKIAASLSGAGSGDPDDSEEEPEDEEDDSKPPLPDMSDNAFKERLSSIMTDNKFDRRLRGRTRGKLDMKALPKVPTMARSIFTQKVARKNKAYNVILLVDESSSMSEDQYDKTLGRFVTRSEAAADATIFLAEAFEKVGVNVAIIGFNKYISVRKEFTVKADYEEIYQAIFTMNRMVGAGYNYDYDALDRAYQMFKKAPKGKNILIMLSDGEPATGADLPVYRDLHGKTEDPKKYHHTISGDKNSNTHLHHLVKAQKNIDSIGIGIQSGGGQIPDHFVVNNISELKPAIVKVLKKKIQRG